MIKVCKKNKMFLDATLTNEKLIEKISQCVDLLNP